MRWLRKLWKPALGMLLSALFLWLAFRDAHLGEVAQALAGARYVFMVPVVLLTLLAFGLRAWRWRFLLAPIREIPIAPLFSSTMIGFMGNNVLPARLGELLRAHSLGHRTGVSRSAALASIVVERIFDIFVLLVLFGAILLLRGLPPVVRSWGWILLFLAAPVFVALVLYQMRSEPLLRMLTRVLPERLHPRVLSMGMNFRDGLGVFRRGWTILAALACSLVMWGCFAIVVTLCLNALHLRLPAEAGIVTLVVMAIGTMIPSAPGYIGTLQYAGSLALLQYGVERPVALSFTLLYHASQWVPVTLIGLLFFLREHLSLRQIPVLPDSGEPAGVPIEAGGSPGAEIEPGRESER